GHSDTVTSVSYSRDGHYIASGSWDKTVKIWDTRSDTLQRNISWHSGWVDSVIYSPDGKFIASGSWDKTAKIWEASSGNLQRTLSDHSKAIESVCYSPDGRYIASGSVDKTVKIWEASSGQLLHTLIGHSNTVTSVIYSPDGQFITSGSWDKSVKIWDASSGKLQRTLSGHSDTVTSVSYSRDGCYIASGSWDTTVKIWDASSGKLHRTLSGHSDRVFGVSYSPDGQFIASGSWDKTVKIWDASSGKLIHTLAGHSSVVTSVNYSPDGNFIASGGFDDTIVIHNAETGDIVSITALLPGNEWLTFNDKKLLYVSSLQGDEYAAVRFDNATWSVYPLKYYRKELKRENFGKAAVEQQPMIRPKPFKVWWDTSEDKGLVGGVAFFGIVTFAFIYNLMKRSDPIVVARAFFKGAGFSRLKPRNKGLYLLSKPNEKALTMAVLWKGDHIIGEKHIEVVINSEKGKYTGKPKIYLIYKEDKHNISEGVKSLRNTYVMTIDIIPLASPILEESLGSLMCKDRLKELEEPYLIRTDPYLERLPVFDPIWFYGREDLIERLPLLISQGQHVCLCGLRKVGKTSLSNQLRQRFVNSPMVYIDCQAMGTSAAAYYKEVSNQFRNKLSSSKIKKLPQIPDDLNGDTFRTIFLLLVRKWEKAKHREQFIIFFDEIDKLFVDRKLPDSEHLLAEYVRLFRVLRGLAQSERCLTTVVITYRPDINRQNNLMETVGENPMYNSFAEEYLGYWNSADSEKMLREIGHWKEIIWSEDSPLRVYELCGGDPLITRMFASAASNKGKLKVITLHRVEETAAETIRTFSENDIGNHYKESILGTLTMDEKQLINHVHAAGASGFNEEDTPSELLDALANLKRFTLVYLENGKLKFRAKLFFEWLKWRM
ncbi:MAG: AAA family ATPase, partial [Nitrospirae bacterium]|nr:AAA family ATPase [Nitrospirota bacterium]